MKHIRSRWLTRVLGGCSFLGLLVSSQPAQAGESVTPVPASSCTVLGGMPGPEDLTAFPGEKAWFLVSSDDRRSADAGKPVRGEIYRVDPANPTAAPLPMTGGQPEEFHPHGISLYQGDYGIRRLFVINHLENGDDAIEVYDVEDSGLKYVKRIKYCALSSPNDVVAVGPMQFYATNDSGSRMNSFKWVIELATKRPWASVSYYDGTDGRIIAKRFKYANGINVSKDGKSIYVAEVMRQTVTRFDRDLTTGALTRQERYHLEGGCDNIELDEKGRLWVASHPSSLKFVQHTKSAANPSPSRVDRIDLSTGEIVRIFDDSGEAMSATATASPAGSLFLLGGVFDPKVLVCPRPDVK